MKLQKSDLFGLTIALLVMLVAYLTSFNLIIALATGIIYASYYFLVAKKMLKNISTSNKKGA